MSGCHWSYPALIGQLRHRRATVWGAPVLLMTKRLLNALPVALHATVETLRVDPEQDLYRLPRPLRHVRWRNATVEPRRHGRVAQVVRSARQRLFC